jgi:hypothetical protein
VNTYLSPLPQDKKERRKMSTLSWTHGWIKEGGGFSIDEDNKTNSCETLLHLVNEEGAKVDFHCDQFDI